jgi:3-deoxy-D-arabino-heptulosonate 7-phosphate (DAHP) synthase
MAFTQAPLGVENEAVFGQLKMAVDAVFAASEVESFLRRVQKSRLRVRDFEGVLKAKLLKDANAAALYAQLGPSDAGQVREHYLQQLEQVEPKLREKFKKLYSYY